MVSTHLSEAILTLWPTVRVPEAVGAKPLEHLLEYSSQTASISTIHTHLTSYETIHTQPKVSTTVFEGCESDSDAPFLIQPVEIIVREGAAVACAPLGLR